MKKVKVLISIIISMFMFCLIPSTSLAGGFSFIDINWDDSPKQVFEKMGKSGEPLSFNKRECDSAFERLLYSQMVNKKLSKSLRKRAYVNYDILSEHGPFNKLREMEIIGLDGIVDEATFYFTCDNKLLSYMLRLDISFTKDEVETGEGKFYQALVEKYGPSTTMSRWTKKWTRDNQSLYYFFTNPNMVFLVYLSDENIEQKLAEIKRLREGFEKQKGGKEADSVKNTF